jgi:UDP-N-acetylmuramoyl-L-alanyl-D-glutamate--2,6-diaminopimelate ligase
MGERESCDNIDNHVSVSDIRAAMATTSARFYGYPGERIKACGVTGTNGKSTVCFLIKSILEARGKKTGLISSVIYDTGNRTFPAERTTPESLDIQRLLYLMKTAMCVNAVIEVSSHALELHRVDHINFRTAVYTNLTRDHLDFHETMEAYFKAKAKLAQRLEGDLSYAVINLDEEAWRPLFGELTCSHMTYSVEDQSADVYCGSYELKPEGTTFDLVTPMGTRTVSFKLPGRFNLSNALAAAAGGMACGVDLDNVVTGLENVQPVPGRLNPIDCGQPFGLYVDFAHTPDAIARLCQTTREFTNKKLLLLFGCGGDRDKGKRPLMGEAATTNADYVVVTSDNPRSEEPESIIEDIKPGLKGKGFKIEVDRKKAIAAVLKKAKKGDVVLLAGKGAESYQEVKGVRQPFSDIEEARAVLAEMGFSSDEASEES